MIGKQHIVPNPTNLECGCYACYVNVLLCARNVIARIYLFICICTEPKIDRYYHIVNTIVVEFAT